MNDFLEKIMSTIAFLFRKIFGFLAVFCGLFILLWLLYNLFIERQPEFEWKWYQGFSVPVVMILIGIYWLRTRGGKVRLKRRKEESRKE
jgi:uncharacterized membrane protein